MANFGQAVLVTGLILVVLGVGLAATNQVFPPPPPGDRGPARRYWLRLQRSSINATMIGLAMAGLGLVIVLAA